MPSALPGGEQNGHAPTMEGRRFLVMERTDNVAAGMASVPPFCIAKALEGVGPVKISLLRNQTTLIETQNAEQTAQVMAIETVGKVSVKVYEHSKLNQSRGVIKCKEIISCDPDELLEHLQEHNVVHIKQIKRHMTDAEHAKCLREKKKPSRKDTGIFVVTFNSPDLPKVLNIGYINPEVKLYIPKPLRCFRCLRLGHAMGTCKEKTEKQMGKKKPPKCVNCAGGHESWSKDCPVYQKECAVLQLKAENRVSYRVAKIFIDVATKATAKVDQGAKAASANGSAEAKSNGHQKATEEPQRLSKNAKKRAKAAAKKA